MSAAGPPVTKASPAVYRTFNLPQKTGER